MDNRSSQQIAEEKFWGSPRRIATTAVCIFLFLLFTIPVRLMRLDSTPEVLLLIRLSLESWGLMIVSSIGMLTSEEIPNIVSQVVISLISILPITFFGYKIGSHNVSTSIKWFIFLIIYLGISFLGALILIFVAD